MRGINEFGNKVEENVYHTKLNGETVRLNDTIVYKYDKENNLIEKIDSRGDVLLKQSFDVCEE